MRKDEGPDWVCDTIHRQYFEIEAQSKADWVICECGYACIHQTKGTKENGERDKRETARVFTTLSQEVVLNVLFLSVFPFG